MLGLLDDLVTRQRAPVHDVLAFLEYRAFLEVQPNPDCEQHDRGAGDEGDAPTPCDDVAFDHDGQQDGPDRRCEQGAAVGAQPDQGGEEPAPLRGGVFGEHDSCTADLGAGPESLQQPQGYQQDGRKHAHLSVGRQVRRSSVVAAPIRAMV